MSQWAQQIINDVLYLTPNDTRNISNELRIMASDGNMSKTRFDKLQANFKKICDEIEKVKKENHG